MPLIDISITKEGYSDSNITAEIYTLDTNDERLEWLDIALRAQGFRGQQALTRLDECILHAHEALSAGPVVAPGTRETLVDLLTRRHTFRQNIVSQAKYLAKHVPYDIWSLVFRLVCDFARTGVLVDLLAHPAALLRPSLDFASINTSFRRDVLNDAALWSFLLVHLGRVLQGDPYELSQIKVYLDRIGDRIPVHLCVRGWKGDDDACTAAVLEVLPFLRACREPAAGPNIKELTVIGDIDNGTGTLKHLPAVFLPLAPSLSALSLLNSSSGIMHSLSLSGFPDPTSLRMLNIDLCATEEWIDDWHFPAMFNAIAPSVHSFRLRTNGTPTSINSGRAPPVGTDIFVCLTELDICLDDIGGCFTGVLLGYQHFIGLQKLTLVTDGQWANGIGFGWAQSGITTWLTPKWLTIVAWVPQNTDPTDKIGFEWVSSAIGAMESVETLELKGVRGTNSHVQGFLDYIHLETPTTPLNTRFRNLKRLVLRDVSFNPTALIQFVQGQKTRASSMGGHAHYIDVVFQGECDGLKAVFEQKRPQGLVAQTPITISNELPTFEGGVSIPIKFVADDD